MLGRQILHYLSEHPDAKDTIQGILRWWLPSTPVELRHAEVQEALEFLVARGWVTKRRLTTSRELYGVNKEKLQEIKSFLHEHESGTEGQ